MTRNNINYSRLLEIKDMSVEKLDSIFAYLDKFCPNKLGDGEIAEILCARYTFKYIDDGLAVYRYYKDYVRENVSESEKYHYGSAFVTDDMVEIRYCVTKDGEILSYRVTDGGNKNIDEAIDNNWKKIRKILNGTRGYAK